MEIDWAYVGKTTFRILGAGGVTFELFGCNAPPVQPMLNPDGSAITTRTPDPNAAPTLIQPTSQDGGVPPEATPGSSAVDYGAISTAHAEEQKSEVGEVGPADDPTPSDNKTECKRIIELKVPTNQGGRLILENFGSNPGEVSITQDGVEIARFDPDKQPIPEGVLTAPPLSLVVCR